MKPRTGCLVKCGGRYYCRVKIGGHVITRALKDADNNPCRTITEARKARTRDIREIALLNRREALEATIRKLAETEEELRAIRRTKVKLSDAWQAYADSSARPRSGTACMWNYHRHAQQFLSWAKSHTKAVYLSDVTDSMCRDYSLYLAANYSAVTHNKTVVFLRLFYRVLCEGERNPFSAVTLLPKDTTPHQPLTPEQIRAVLAKAKGELHTLLLVGAYTALRRQDACLLRWNQIDMARGVITVTPRKTASRSGKTVVIPIHPELRKHLDTLFPAGEYVMPKMARWYVHDSAHISRRIRDLFEGCGIKTQMDVDRKGTKRNNKTLFSFHSFRMSMGQQLISNGYTLDQIAQVLGHTSVVMARHYSTITDSVKERAIMSLPSIA